MDSGRSAIVCGAGIAGLTVARQLALAGWSVTVLERAAGRRDQGYLIDFFGPGFEAAEHMGLLPRLRELAYPFTIRFVDDRGRARASIDVDRVARSVSGRLLSLMRPDLELALAESLPSAVDIRYGHALAGVEQTGDTVTVTLDDGTTHDADLLVGADGIHSTVRERIFGAEAKFLRFLGFHTFAFLVENEALRQRLAGSAAMTDSLDRFLGLYALRDGRIAVVGAHRTTDPVRPADPRAAILEAYAGLGWLTADALACAPPSADIYYDVVCQVELPRWCAGRVALVGDASSAVSLLAGQGASIAIAGGVALATAVHEAPTLAAGLDDYEGAMRPVVLEKQRAGRRAARSFVPPTRWARLMRRVALRLITWPGIGRVISSRITGKTATRLRK